MCYVLVLLLLLCCTRYEVSDEVQRAYSAGLRSSVPASIPFTRNYIKSYTKLTGETDLGIYNIYIGRFLPESIYLGFVPQSAFIGSATENPFEFKSLELLEASLLVNSYNEPR